MKKLLYLGIILMLGSCGANESESTASDGANESESAASTVNVDGREISTIKIGNLEVMTEDLGEMKWGEAMDACETLGDGWRLPTKDELNISYKNKEKIGGFTDYTYWSSTDRGSFIAWIQDFNLGRQSLVSKHFPRYFRAVRGGDSIIQDTVTTTLEEVDLSEIEDNKEVIIENTQPITWNFIANSLGNDKYEIKLQGFIDQGWQTYSTTVEMSDEGPLGSWVTFETSDNYDLIDGIIEENAHSYYDETWEMDIIGFSNEAIFKQKIKINSSTEFTLKGNINFMVCKDGACLPPEDKPFEITITP
tara:strand:- start:445 stop:1362 length:918 start_codon:yes stop_codon:yes gene_type:complete